MSASNKIKPVEVAATVTETGKIQFENELYRRVFNGYLMRNKGMRIIITARRAFRRRTMPQNNFFHGVLVPAYCRAMGHDEKNRDEYEYVKFHLKEMFLTKTIESGKQYVGDTSELTVEEFTDFIESCIDYLFQIPEGHLEGQEIIDYFDAIGKKIPERYTHPQKIEEGGGDDNV